MNQKKKISRFPIAIVGIGCRYPGKVNDPESYWNLLINKVDAISEIPRNRWNLDKFYSDTPNVAGKSYSKWGGFLDDIDYFDPECFSISPREAEFMDPQQRLILECAHAALLDGGQLLEDFSGSNTGVFVGLSNNDYAQIQAGTEEQQHVAPHSVTGNALCIVANRVSYTFNLKGPSMTVDTACSSSLVATHLACQSLWNGECDTAFAGGVNVILLPNAFISFCSAGMLSPDGRCQAFDAAANGFVRGEGAGMVLLKPLDQALAENDQIYAIIKNSAVNHDGRTAGLPLPGKDAQRSLIKTVYQDAGINRNDVYYVEAHGTGTAVGDPVEANTLGEVLGQDRDEDEKLLIGSVKTNIGHLEGGAGVAALIKVALCLKNRTLPASLHFDTPNPEIDFQKFNLKVVTETIDIPENLQKETIIGVNSFGIGGTNAHVILSDYKNSNNESQSLAPPSFTPPQNQRTFILPLSAPGDEGLQLLVNNYINFLSLDKHSSLTDICYSAGKHRDHYQQRLTLVAQNRDQFKELLQAFINSELRPGMTHRTSRRNTSQKLAFVFTGQGPQWWAMGRELLNKEPVFRRKVEECDQLFKSFAEWSLWLELTADEESSHISETAISQPLIFTLQVALAALWQAQGIKPSALIGHSVGEVAAAHLAGAFDLKTALKVIYFRGHCMQHAITGGAMAALGVGQIEAEKIIQPFSEKVSISAINSPTSVTLSGDEESLHIIGKEATKNNIFFRFLVVQYAFHSPRMDPVEKPLKKALQQIDLAPLKTPIYSTVTGNLVSQNFYNAEYWWENVREKVSFGPAIEKLLNDGFDTFIEIGPHPVLASSILECATARKIKDCLVLPSLRRREDEQTVFFGSLGALHASGYLLDWKTISGDLGNFCKIPGYPRIQKAYWHEAPSSAAQRLGEIIHPFLNSRIEAADPTWITQLDIAQFSYLADHRVQKKAVFPAAAYIECALAAGTNILQNQAFVIEHLQYQKALFIPDDRSIYLQFTFLPDDSSFTIRATGNRFAGTWTTHCTGYIRALPAHNRKLTLVSLQETYVTPIVIDDIYQRLQRVGLDYGPGFKGIINSSNNPSGNINASLSEVALPETVKNCEKYHFHPALLDACLQCIFTAFPVGVAEKLFLPVATEQIRYHQPMEKSVKVYCHINQINNKVLSGDLTIFSAKGELLLEIKGFQCRAIDSATDSDCSEYRYFWKPQALGKTTLQGEPGFLPNLDLLSQNMHAEADFLYQTEGGEKGVNTSYRFLDKLSRAYIAQAFKDLDSKIEPEDFKSHKQWAEAFNIPQSKHRQLLKLLTILEASDLAYKNQAGQWAFVLKPSQSTIKELEKEAILQHSSVYPEFALLQRCGANLALVMRGEIDPLKLLFPEGSTASMEHFYLDSLSFRSCNRIVQRALIEICNLLPHQSTLRILEIGAGSGGLTGNILHLLPSDRTEYFFTDISKHFFSKAEQKFINYPFVHYEYLDIEKDFDEELFNAHSFDLILASDVLHATANLGKTIENLKVYMASNGLLIFIEPDKEVAWVDTIFGLTEGWWNFTDDDSRTASPLISQKAWLDLLRDKGFKEAVAIPQFRDNSAYGQTVFMARGPQLSPTRAKTAEDQLPETFLENLQNSRNWLLFTDQSGTAEALQKYFTSSQDCVIQVKYGPHFLINGDDYFQIQKENIEDLEQLFASITLQEPINIVYLWSLDCPPPDDTGLEYLLESEKLSSHPLINLLKTLQHRNLLNLINRLFIITRGAQPCYTSAAHMALGQTPIIGLSRVIQNEHPDICCTSIDLDPKTLSQKTETQQEARLLFAELTRKSPEDEILLRDNCRYIPRLRKLVEKPVLSDCRDYRIRPNFNLEVAGTNSIDHLRLQELEVCALQDDEIEISVQAASLNFRDVMKTLGLYPSENADDWQLGDECAGLVVAVGKNVDNFKAGDAVVAIASNCLSSRVITKPEHTLKKPEHISFAEAVTIPIVFLTAAYALHHLARISPGDRVLIQAAAGGVGLAAIQIAQLAGAEVFATAGSPQKRALLRGLGVNKIMDSRSLAFADQVMLQSQGQGVDIVLNSLAGEALFKGVECLSPYGRFLELGKIDIYKNSRLGLHSLRRNITFHTIDLSSLLIDKPQLARTLLERIFTDLKNRKLHPLPHRVFPVSRTQEAFRYMAQGKHTGKIVISMNDSAVPIYPLKKKPAPLFNEKGSYLITGGFGGFGLTLANWIVEQGGTHLVLVGRKGAASPEAREALERFKNQGIKVLAEAIDISSRTEVEPLFARIGDQMPPLRGIFHTAMVMEDGVVSQISPKRFSKVNAPKVLGCWNLHLETLHLKLDYFVLFSSFSALVGNPGQGSYAAANLFLDTFAAYRRGLQLPAVSINWGALAEVGFVARNQTVSELLERKGFIGIPPAEAMRMLGQILRQNPVQTGPTYMNWNTWAQEFKNRRIPPRFQELFNETDLAQTEQSNSGAIRDEIIGAAPEKQGEIMHNYLQKQIAAVLRVPTDRLHADQPLQELGMDSLMMVELNFRVENDLLTSLPIAQLTKNPTLGELSVTLLTAVTNTSPTTSTQDNQDKNESLKPDSTNLLPLRSTGSKPAVFCFHPAGGDTSIYTDLVKALPGDYPVYAMQSRVFSGAEHEYSSFTAMAKAYAEIISKQQDSGPYFLLGFCFGGFLALTVAHLLQERGHRVAFTGLIDCNLQFTQSAFKEQSRDCFIAEIYHQLAETLKERLEISPLKQQEDCQALLNTLKKSGAVEYEETICDWLIKHKYLHEKVEIELARKYFRLTRIHSELLQEFALLPTTTNLTHWIADNSFSENKEPEKLFAANKGATELIKLSASHFKIISPPTVTALARQLEWKLMALFANEGETPTP